MPPEYRARIEAGRPRLDAIARERYGVELSRGPLGQDSRPALIGAKYAEQQGLGAAYHDAVFQAYWREAQPIGERAVLAEIAAGVGLQPGAFLAALDDPQLDALVGEDVDLAAAYGLTGVPAIVFEQRYLVSGAQPTSVLRQVVERIMADGGEPPA
jgi:predicted DsbA family dithiol-disulfide isomerase